MIMKPFLFYTLPVLAYLVLIFYLSSLSSVGISLSFDSNSLSLHAIEYSILGFLLCRAFSNSKYQSKALLLSIILSIFYGATDEIHQMFVPFRTATLLDLSADSLGSMIGAFAYFKLFRR